MSEIKSDDLNQAFVSRIEPFVDFGWQEKDVLINAEVKQRVLEALISRLGDENSSGFYERLLEVLAEIQQENYYLKLAYLNGEAQEQPLFDVKMPSVEKIKPSSYVIDMRSSITGGNWYSAESDGRWSGPEARSSLLFPALSTGKYRFEVLVVGEIVDGLVDSLTLTFNDEHVDYEKHFKDGLYYLSGSFEFKSSYKKPFTSFVMLISELHSPASLSDTSSDDRLLGVRVKSVTILPQ